MVDTQPRQLVVAALVVLGALTALRDLLGAWDRLRMDTEVRGELDQLPTTDEGDS